jgi:hypothetical protein
MFTMITGLIQNLAVDTETCTGETENQPKWMFIPKKYGFERY